MYDSRADTLTHIRVVNSYLTAVCDDLHRRAVVHDESKLHSPEKEAFDEYTPLLEKLVYGSDEYKEALVGLGPALKHHYEFNDHHPEHFENGIHDMSLVQMIEMLIDWKAAGERHGGGGDIRRSIEINAERFGYSDELKQVFINTAYHMGWIS